MKKLLTAVLATVMVCGLAACGGDNTSKPATNPSTNSGNQTPVTITYDFSGVETTAVQFSNYNVFDGVSVLASTGAELKTRATATSDCGITDKLLDTSVVKTCKIDYTITMKFSGQEVTETATRNVEIVAPTIQAGNLVSNANFELGTKDWELATHEGGNGEFSVEKTDVMGVQKNAAKVVMKGINNVGNASSPRLNSATYATNNTNNDGRDARFTMTGGQKYKVSFKAKALVTKYVEVSIGKLIPEAPWYTPFTTNEQIYVAEITNEWKEFEYTFQAASPTLEACSILFSMGVVKPTEDVMTTLWYTDVYVGVFDGNVVDTKAPTIYGANEAKVPASSTPFDLLAGITASDDMDGDISGSVRAFVNGTETRTLDVTNEGTYTVTYKVKDNAGNETTATRTIVVVAAGASLLPEYNAAKFKEDAYASVEANINHAFVDEADGSVKIVKTGTGWENYHSQININNLPCIGGVSYTLTFEVKSSIALTATFLKNHSDYAVYASAEIPASNDFVTVTMNINAPAIDPNNKMTIELGLLGEVTFWIRNVKLVQN